MPSTMVTTQTQANLLEPILESLFWNSMAATNKGLVADQIMEVKSTKKDTETMLTIGDQAQPTEFVGAIAYDTIAEGYKTTTKVKQYAKGIKIEDYLIRTNQYPEFIQQVVPEMARKAKYKIEATKMDLFNNAFNTSSFTFGDTYALCATAHTVPGGAFTQGNLGTTAFSITELKSIIQIMNKYKDYAGDPLVDLMPDTILCHTDLYHTVYETIKTSYGLNVTSQNVNPVFQSTEINGSFKIITSKFLNDANNFFVMSGDYAKRMFAYFELAGVETATIQDFDSMAVKYREYHAGNIGARNWWAVYGANVA